MDISAYSGFNASVLYAYTGVSRTSFCAVDLPSRTREKGSYQVIDTIFKANGITGELFCGLFTDDVLDYNRHDHLTKV